ncbi:hypothetical protein ACVPOR_02550 [Staphylococcus aureus]
MKPGGLLYFHVHEPRVKFKSWSDIDENKLEQDLIKKFKLSGLVNADQTVIDALVFV